MRECEWWDQVQKSSILKDHVRKNFPYKLPLSKETLLTRIHEDKLFGYVQCDLEVPEELCERFANFPPIFKNCDVGRENIGNFMLEYAEKKRVVVKTSTNVDFELQIKQWNSHNTIFKVLFEAGSMLYQNPQIL